MLSRPGGISEKLSIDLSRLLNRPIANVLTAIEKHLPYLRPCLPFAFQEGLQRELISAVSWKIRTIDVQSRAPKGKGKGLLISKGKVGLDCSSILELER